MDSITQFALGAGVGLAVLGRRLGPRRAALTGGVLGTLPDLDVFYPFDDPIDAFVWHRAASHSLIVQAVATPVIGEVLIRLFSALRSARGLTYAAVYLILATHALLDAFTVYGTRIFWPVMPEPVGIGSLFIIDPLYTLPLLVALIWALFLRAWTPRFRAVLTWCLALPTLYLGWSLVAQQAVLARADAVLAESGVVPTRVMATPTPFNTLSWRVIAINGADYFNIYVPVLGGADAVTVYRHARGPAGDGCLDGLDDAARLAAFSKGFYRTELRDGALVLSDLRMGLTPNYVFRFIVAEHAGDQFRPVPPRRVPVERQIDGDLDWLFANLSGFAAVRPAEAAQQLAPAEIAGNAAPADAQSITC